MPNRRQCVFNIHWFNCGLTQQENYCRWTRYKFSVYVQPLTQSNGPTACVQTKAASILLPEPDQNRGETITSTPFFYHFWIYLTSISRLFVCQNRNLCCRMLTGSLLRHIHITDVFGFYKKKRNIFFSSPPFKINCTDFDVFLIPVFRHDVFIINQTRIPSPNDHLMKNDLFRIPFGGFSCTYPSWCNHWGFLFIFLDSIWTINHNSLQHIARTELLKTSLKCWFSFTSGRNTFFSSVLFWCRSTLQLTVSNSLCTLLYLQTKDNRILISVYLQIAGKVFHQRAVS